MDALPALDRQNRWIALVVLCVGMLMIILDATIVNVALPAIQSDLGFSQSAPGLGRQRLPDPVRRPAAAGRPARRPDRAPLDLPHRPDRLHRGLARLRPGADQRRPDRRPLHPGHRRRADLGRHPRHARDHVPRAARPGPGHRRLQPSSAAAGGSIGLLAGGVLTQAHQLALDLLRQPAHRHRHRRRSRAAARARPGHRPRPGRRRARRGARHRRADARACYTIVGAADIGWALGAHAGLRGVGRRAAGGIRRSRGAHPRPAPAAADLPVANVVRRQLDPGLLVARACSRSFFLGALYLQRVLGFSPLAGRRRVPAGLGLDRRHVALLLGRG